jgi:hypothetical protein
VFGRYFLLADQAARACGVRLRLRTDMAALWALNERERATWHALIPAFDARFNELGPDNAFWIEGLSESGDSVIAQTARLFDWDETTCAEEIRSLRLLYQDPARDALPGEAWEVTAPMASAISGRVTFSGGTWIRPDYRGHALSRLLPRQSRACAYVMWGTACTVGLVEFHMIEKGYLERYGHRHAQPAVNLRRTRLGDRDAAFVWLPRSELIEDVDSFCSALHEGAAIDGGRQDQAVVTV